MHAALLTVEERTIEEACPTDGSLDGHFLAAPRAIRQQSKEGGRKE
jgi:hypothetical protein